MTPIGTISKLLDERVETFIKQTKEIFEKISDRLTPAFQKVYESPDRMITWTNIEQVKGTDRAVIVSGYMTLKVGDVIKVGEDSITIDEKNVNEYNKFVKFAFPIVMLELASTQELADHILRMSHICGSKDVAPEQIAKMLDKIADAFETAIMNDPSSFKILDDATKPSTVLGFNASDLTDEQILKLKLYEKNEVETLN